MSVPWICGLRTGLAVRNMNFSNTGRKHSSFQQKSYFLLLRLVLSFTIKRIIQISTPDLIENNQTFKIVSKQSSKDLLFKRKWWTGAECCCEGSEGWCNQAVIIGVLPVSRAIKPAVVIRLHNINSYPYEYNLVSSTWKFPAITKSYYSRRDDFKTLHACYRPLNMENVFRFSDIRPPAEPSQAHRQRFQNAAIIQEWRFFYNQTVAGGMQFNPWKDNPYFF